jgi:hypothetical protein
MSRSYKRTPQTPSALDEKERHVFHKWRKQVLKKFKEQEDKEHINEQYSDFGLRNDDVSER